MINSTLRKAYKALPEGVRDWLTPRILPLVSPVSRWVSSVYTPFGEDQRRYIYLSIARHLHINRPMEGYYFEFGSHEGRTMRMAWRSFRHLFKFDYVAFDSFEGLPDVVGHDAQEVFKKGKLKTEIDIFRALVGKAGMPMDRLTTVKGFYDQTLTPELKQKLSAKKAAVVYIDCDLYFSTIPVLEFIKDFLQRGTVIVFDDWYCYHGDPMLGEQRAFSEFRQRYPELRFAEFVRTCEAQSFIYLGTESEAQQYVQVA